MEEFIAPLPISRNVRSVVAYREEQHSGLKMLIAPLETDSEFVAPLPTAVCSEYKAADRAVCAVDNLFPNSQQLYEMAL